MKDRIVFIIILVCGISIAWVTADHHSLKTSKNRMSGKLDIEDILRHKPDGTPPRLEMETKYVVEGTPEMLRNNSYLLELMHREVAMELKNELQWQAPKYVNGSYTICPIGLGTFCFLDVYLDTPDFLNEKWNIAQRVRYRWHSRGGFIKYMLGDERPENFPHRCEYQLKAYRAEQTEGFYISNEARFEFRNESLPFKQDNSAPPPPWRFEEFIPPAITGMYNNYHTWFSYEYARYLSEVEPNIKEVELAPCLVTIMTRRRFHLNLPTSWGQTAGTLGMGSMVNAAQAMVITLDTNEVYRPDILDVYFLSREAKQKNILSKKLLRQLKNRFVPVGVYTEAEFEFERNVESALHEEMKHTPTASEAQHLHEIETAFLKDEALVCQIVRRALLKAGLTASPTDLSKYRKDRQILRSNGTVGLNFSSAPYTVKGPKDSGKHMNFDTNTGSGSASMPDDNWR
ncbi:MAG: hypothetical protein HQM09_12080 [Candidatus Riflebacteria bacterium]|nr:hypothetical protein [Candidatus Riflebacteria bacterium]